MRLVHRKYYSFAIQLFKCYLDPGLRLWLEAGYFPFLSSPFNPHPQSSPMLVSQSLNLYTPTLITPGLGIKQPEIAPVFQRLLKLFKLLILNVLSLPHTFLSMETTLKVSVHSSPSLCLMIPLELLMSGPQKSELARELIAAQGILSNETVKFFLSFFLSLIVHLASSYFTEVIVFRTHFSCTINLHH